MRKVFLMMLFLVLLTSTVSASSWEVYDGESDLAANGARASVSPDYSVGTTNYQIFSAVAAKLPFGTHYVYWRNNQNEYRLAYSPDLEFDGSRFTAPEVTIVSYAGSGSYNSIYSFGSETDTNFTLDPGSYLVWSDLGDYPLLYERGGEDYAKLACIILCSFALYYLWHHMWADIRQRFI